MSEWYYARAGQQNGPISYEQLVELARGLKNRSRSVGGCRRAGGFEPADRRSKGLDLGFCGTRFTIALGEDRIEELA
jgi:hypothetical protein